MEGKRGHLARKPSTNKEKEKKKKRYNSPSTSSDLDSFLNAPLKNWFDLHVVDSSDDESITPHTPKIGSFVNRFQGKEGFKSYLVDWEGKIVLHESVFAMHCLPRKLSTNIIARGWQQFLEMPNDTNQCVVREFYESLSLLSQSEHRKTLFVRDVQIRCVPQFFNSILKTKNIYPDFFQTHGNAHDNKFLMKVSQILTWQSGWVLDSSENIIGLAVEQLKTEASALRHKVLHRLLPPLGSYFLTIEQALLIYAILRDFEVDIGALIWLEMEKVAKSTSRDGSPYGSLITMLAKEAGVMFDTNDLWC